MDALLAVAALLAVLQIGSMVYNTKIHSLNKIPGHWTISSSSFWIRWQRWNGRLSFKADELLTKYGPIVRISPNMVLLNDYESVERTFVRKDLDTAPTSIRALRVGGHDWTVTYPQHPIARQRRHPVMIATTTKCMKFWHQTFVKNIHHMIEAIADSRGTKSEDIVRHLRICTLKNSQIIMGGAGVDLNPDSFPHVVGEYNFLVVWRLCLPTWAFEWLKYGPFAHSRFRIKSSDKLYDLGAEICQQAEANPVDENEGAVPSVYSLFTDESAKYPTQTWSRSELSAEMAGQVLAATETTSSALTFILYELAKNPSLLAEVEEEVKAVDLDGELDSLKLLDSCIKEGLRFRPPVALTGSRLVPKGGLNILGYYLPEGTVVTTQSLSMSRQRPDLFPDYNDFNPKRWVDDAKAAERRNLSVPFGVGARRCPGSNMALYQMRLILAAILSSFEIRIAPETTPKMMEPFEANGYRSRHDRCDLIFIPRTT
ncbi:cytochrome p450 monooxygenase [Seiridium cupressi]